MKKLSNKIHFFYGIGVSYFMLDQIFNQWVQYFYIPPAGQSSLKGILSLESLLIGFAIIRLIDAIADPLVGYLSDHSSSKLGRRSFFMLLGGLPLSLSIILFFFPIGNTQLQNLIYFIIVGSIFFIAYTLVGGPYNALLADIANNKEERLKLSTIQSVFRLLFTALPMILSPLMVSSLGKGDMAYGIRVTVIIFAVLSSIGVYTSIFALKEPEIVKHKEKKETVSFKRCVKFLFERETALYFLGFFFYFSGFNIIRNSVNYLVTIVMGKSLNFATIITAILFGVAALFFPITGKIVKKIGYKKTMILDLLLIIIGVIGIIIFAKISVIAVYIMFAVVGTGVSGSAFIFPPAMLSEISAKLTEREKVSVEGVMFGIQGLFLKLALLVQLEISTFVLSFWSDGVSATEKGVYGTLIAAIILLIISTVFYSVKKNEV